ncbi:MAG: hypothetical protein LBK06_10270 [Planctomycetaceae bacterium]|nr:hypothetical protein [Planctomycetaceae bacterium]
MKYTKAVLKFAKLNTVAQQREAVTRGRSLLPYRLRYNRHKFADSLTQASNMYSSRIASFYAEAVLKFAKLNTAAQQRGAVVQGRSLLPYRLWYYLASLRTMRSSSSQHGGSKFF